MAIRVKYDPIGGPALAAYAHGAGQGRERQFNKLLEQSQRTAEMYQRANEREEDRDLAIDLARGRERLAIGLDELGAGRDVAEADLAFRRSGLGMAPAPDGVALNPIASKRWRELENAKRSIMGGRDFDPMLPDSAAALARIEEEQSMIQAMNKAPTPEESRKKYTYYRDAAGGEVSAGTPGATEWYYDPAEKKPPVAVTQPNDSAKDAAADTQKRATWIASQANKYMAQRDKYSSYDEGGLEKKHDDPVYSQEQAWEQAEKDYERMFGAGAAAPSPGVASPPAAPPAAPGAGAPPAADVSAGSVPSADVYKEQPGMTGSPTPAVPTSDAVDFFEQQQAQKQPSAGQAAADAQAAQQAAEAKAGGGEAARDRTPTREWANRLPGLVDDPVVGPIAKQSLDILNKYKPGEQISSEDAWLLWSLQQQMFSRQT